MSFIQKFTKRDLFFAVVTGLITGVIGQQIFTFLNVEEFYGIPWTALIIVVPVLWILGVLLGYFLGQWLGFFNQFGKFAAIGFTNASVDFGILNTEIALTGIVAGAGYAVLKTISFSVALLSSYIWNKYWAFNASGSRGGTAEFGKFVIVTVVAFLVNVGIASFVVNYVHPLAGMDPKQWANMAAVIASAISLIFSFVGFKLAVFRG